MAEIDINLIENEGRIDALKSKKYDAFTKFMHINRYEIAKNIIEKKTSENNLVIILDLGCGSGYGSTLLSGKNKIYIGSDISVGALKYAKRVYKIENLIAADCTRLPFKDNSFDFVVFFEVIEHINVEEQKLALREIARCLKNGGLLFISTPNREYLMKKIYEKIFRRKMYKFHKAELSFKDFKFVLERQSNLKIIRMMGQNILPHFLGKFLYSVAPNFTKHLSNLLGKIFTSQATHFISVLEKIEA